VHLVRLHFAAQRGVHALVPLHRALALEFGRDDQGRPVTAVTLDFEVFAGQPGGD